MANFQPVHGDTWCTDKVKPNLGVPRHLNRSRRPCCGLGVILAICLLSSASVVAQGTLTGAELAETIEHASPERAQTLLLRVDQLSKEEQAAFVAWATQQRTDQKPWKQLAPALVRIGSRAAFQELRAMITSPSYEATLALQVLVSLPPEQAWGEICLALQEQAPTTRVDLLRVAAEWLAAHPTWIHELRARNEQDALMIRQIVSDAAFQATPLDVFFEVTHGGPPHMCLGLLDGISRRLKRAPHQGDHMLPFLRELSHHEDPQIVTAVFRILPLALKQLDPSLTPRLIAALESEDSALRAQAWHALRTLSGAKLPQSASAWKKWHQHRLDREFARIADIDPATQPETAATPEPLAGIRPQLGSTRQATPEPRQPESTAWQRLTANPSRLLLPALPLAAVFFLFLWIQWRRRNAEPIVRELAPTKKQQPAAAWRERLLSQSARLFKASAEGAPIETRRAARLRTGINNLRAAEAESGDPGSSADVDIADFVRQLTQKSDTTDKQDPSN